MNRDGNPIGRALPVYFLPKKDVSDFIPERSTLASLLFFLEALPLPLDGVVRFADVFSPRRRSNRLISSSGVLSIFAGVLVSGSTSLTLSYQITGISNAARSMDFETRHVLESGVQPLGPFAREVVANHVDGVTIPTSDLLREISG